MTKNRANMIIAIDESGDFAQYSERYNFFVAVLLDERDNGVERKRAQFEAWKATIPREKFGKGNEVKGTELSDFEIFSFTKDVSDIGENNRVIRL